MPQPSAHLAHALMQLCATAFLAILFLQSGLDKLFDWAGNLAYQTEHFAKSPLRTAVPLLLGTLTLLELSSGALSALGAGSPSTARPSPPSRSSRSSSASGWARTTQALRGSCPTSSWGWARSCSPATDSLAQGGVGGK